jgi:undecaprenyl-phosphate 4-deoxy-4-formamido-L-arabinose transferase
MTEPLDRTSFTYSIVIPVFNSEPIVGDTIDQVVETFTEAGLRYELILVNDGSSDRSWQVISERAARLPHVVALNLMRNYGQHYANLAGFTEAGGDYVITMDDDLQNPISEVVKLFEHARAGGWDVVYTYYAEKKHAAWRNLGSRFANKVADVLLDKPRGLYLSSFRCMSAFVARSITIYEGPFPYVDGLILQTTQHIDRIAVEHVARASGQSNYTVRRLVRLWLNLFINFSAMPLRISVVAGFCIGLMGILGFVIVIAEALLDAPPPGWASLMAATLLISGVQMVMLGILGEYLGRLFLTANRKPQSLVREIVRPAAEAPPMIQAVPREAR